jgi:DNA-binding NtrC family response regulator
MSKGKTRNGGHEMNWKKIIRGRRILIVDDEKDILDTLVELLDICRIDTALSFEEGKRFLETEDYDVAILDIMGVKGFDLLAIANSRKIPALMLTAHALTKENLQKSAEGGASYYAPKDKIADIGLFVADIIEAREKNKNVWVKWVERLGGFYDRRFTGPNWREQQKEFWDEQLKPYKNMY